MSQQYDIQLGEFRLRPDLSQMVTGGQARGYPVQELGDGGRELWLKSLLAPEQDVSSDEYRKWLHQLERLTQETRCLHALSEEPGVVDILADGEFSGAPYVLLLEKLDRIEWGRWQENEVVELIDSLLSTILRVRTKNILYRDLHHKQVMIRPGGQYVLVDFGSAHVHDSGITTNFRKVPLNVLWQHPACSARGGRLDPGAHLFESFYLSTRYALGKLAVMARVGVQVVEKLNFEEQEKHNFAHVTPEWIALLETHFENPIRGLVADLLDPDPNQHTSLDVLQDRIRDLRHVARENRPVPIETVDVSTSVAIDVAQPIIEQVDARVVRSEPAVRTSSPSVKRRWSTALWAVVVLFLGGTALLWGVSHDERPAGDGSQTGQVLPSVGFSQSSDVGPSTEIPPPTQQLGTKEPQPTVERSVSATGEGTSDGRSTLSGKTIADPVKQPPQRARPQKNVIDAPTQPKPPEEIKVQPGADPVSVQKPTVLTKPALQEKPERVVKPETKPKPKLRIKTRTLPPRNREKPGRTTKLRKTAPTPGKRTAKQDSPRQKKRIRTKPVLPIKTDFQRGKTGIDNDFKQRKTEMDDWLER